MVTSSDVRKEGFTLIELLVVISIIGLLSSVVLAALSDARIQAKNAHIKTELMQLRNVFELLRNSDGTYPLTVGSKSKINLTANQNSLLIYNDIITNNGTALSPIISYADSAVVTMYSIYVALLPINTQYICVDSKGNMTTGNAINMETTNLLNGGYCR